MLSKIAERKIKSCALSSRYDCRLSGHKLSNHMMLLDCVHDMRLWMLLAFSFFITKRVIIQHLLVNWFGLVIVGNSHYLESLYLVYLCSVVSTNH